MTDIKEMCTDCMADCGVRGGNIADPGVAEQCSANLARLLDKHLPVLTRGPAFTPEESDDALTPARLHARQLAANAAVVAAMNYTQNIARSVGVTSKAELVE